MTKARCDLDSKDNAQECVLLAAQLIDAMITAISHMYFSSVTVFLFITGLGVQFSVFLCGQMELQQHSFYVRSPENLLLLPERGAH